jgi:ABC-2 type transport system permease protein
MIGHIVGVFSYELRRNLRRKGFLFTAFGIPVLGFVVFMGIQALAGDSNDPEEQSDDAQIVGYVDESGLFADPPGIAIFESPEAVEAARQSGNLSPRSDAIVYYDDEESAQAALDSEAIDGFYIIAEDYVETGSVTQVIPRFALELADTDYLINQILLSRFIVDVSPDIAIRMFAPANIEEIAFQRTPTESGATDTEGAVADGGDNDFGIIYLFALVLMFGLFGTNGYLMQSVIEEKENHVIEILMSSVRPISLLAGKIMALGLLGLCQIVAWLVVIFILNVLAGGSENLPGILSFLQDIDVGAGALIMFFVYFLLGYLFFAAGYGAVGAMSVSLQQGPNMAVVFTIPVVIPLMFITVFAESPDAALPVILSILPFTSPLAMPMRMVMIDVPIIQILASVGLLILLDVTMIWVASRLFRAHTLLAGQVPKLRELPGLIRG